MNLLMFAYVLVGIIAAIAGTVIGILVRKNHALTAALELETAKLEDVTLRLNDLKAELLGKIDAQAAEIASYRKYGDTIEAASREADRLEKLVQTTSEELNRSKEAVQVTKNELNQFETEKGNLGHEIEGLRTEKQQLTAEIESLKAERREAFDRLRETQGIESAEIEADSESLSAAIVKIDGALKSIESDWHTTSMLDDCLKHSFGIWYYDVVLIGLNEMGLIEACYGMRDTNGGPVEVKSIGGHNFVVVAKTDQPSYDSVMNKVLTDQAITTWVVVGAPTNGKCFTHHGRAYTFPSGATVLHAEFDEGTRALYGGSVPCFGTTYTGRFAMLEEKRKALENKRAELSRQLNAVNMQAAVTVGINALLAS